MDLKRPVATQPSNKRQVPKHSFSGYVSILLTEIRARTLSAVSSSEEDNIPPKTKASKGASQPGASGKDTHSKKTTARSRPKKAPSNAARVQPPRKLLIAVDFGTTYSGVAWAQSYKPEIQSIIQQWPDMSSDGLEGKSSDKVPTEILYDDDGAKFGYQIQDGVLRHQGFKLDLSPEGPVQNELSERYSDPLAAPPDYDMSAEKLCTDYLTALRETTERSLRQKLPASVLNQIPTEYIITMPAVWNEKAQSRTLACAKKAGLDPILRAISEPEAAAIYTLDAMDPHKLNVGDTFVLCDAGGGTVDLISYRIETLEPVLKLEEAAPGSGDFYGSMFVNRRFQEFIKQKLGHLKGWDDDVLQEATEKFEMIKRSFAGNVTLEHFIPVSGVEDSPDLGVARSRYILTGQDIKALFEPIIAGTLSLLEGQIDKTGTLVKGILLVGGLGQSPYLRISVREAFPGVIVMQPPNGWTAVARGALMRGLALTSPYSTTAVTKRFARKWYGVRLARLFEDGDRKSLRFQDDYEGDYFISTMEWFVGKGDLVKEGETRRLEYSKEWPVEGSHHLVLKPEIYCYDSPTRKTPAKYPCEKGIDRIAELTIDLNKIPKKNIPQYEGSDGRLYNVITFTILVTPELLSTKYELLFQRHKYGLVEAEYI